MINKSVNLSQWINENTVTSRSVVELGAGFFRRLENVHSNVKTKIGIEIYKPYIDNATYHNCIKIHGDALKYRELLVGYDLDTVLIVDVLEHFEKEIGFKWINDLKQDFKKILLMLPAGRYEQNEDVTGFGGHEYQTHRSYWYVEDIEKLQFLQNIIDPTFHSAHHAGKIINVDTACYFGIWKNF
jgi:hypothetical protein